MEFASMFRLSHLAAACVVFLAGAVTVVGVNAQSAPSPTKQAVENRRAAFLLVGNTFRWFGAVAKGTIPYDEAEATKRAARVAFLSGLVGENFPEGSNPGEPDSKAKPDVWSNRADFDKKLKDFETHAQALVEVNAKEKNGGDAFKAAVAALAGDCKGCHETYKAK
jgi:cytochrome c556